MLRPVLMLLALASPITPAAIAGDGQLALACTFEGGKAKFVAILDRSAGTAEVSSPRGGMKSGVVTPYGELVFFVSGTGTRGAWRDTYFVSDTGGTFAHLHEEYPDGPDKPPFMAGQSGTCVRQ